MPMQSSGLRNFEKCTIKKNKFCQLGSFILKIYIPSFGIKYSFYRFPYCKANK